jgi:hypothetical protein
MSRTPWAWRDDILDRHCECPWRAVTVPSGDKPTRELNGVTWEWAGPSDTCKLHSPDGRYDLPEGVM